MSLFIWKIGVIPQQILNSFCFYIFSIKCQASSGLVSEIILGLVIRYSFGLKIAAMNINLFCFQSGNLILNK